MRRLAVLTCAFTALVGPALAGTPVQLRAQLVSHGAEVTLGDVFDGAGSAAEVVIARAAPPGSDAVLDAGAVQLAARRAGLDWDNGSGFHRIAVSAAASAGPAKAATRSGRPKAISRHGHADQALTYARNIAAGEILAAEDLVWSDEVVAPADGVSDPEAAIVKAARHALRSGAAAALRDLASPRVIKRDDVVAVVFEADGVSLTLQAKAMGDASVGDTVEVSNPQSKKVIEAVCIGPGQAVVGPRADALKAAINQNGGQGRLVTASLR